MKRIPLSAPDITEAEIQAVTAVLRTSRLSLGPELEEFEKALAHYHGVDDAVAVSSGTAGLHLALLALGIGSGDEVVIPSFTFIAVANAVLQVQATPVFADVDRVTLNLDPASVERSLTPNTKAILVVHTFGVPAQMDALQTIARRNGLFLIEDACEAVGARFGDPPRDKTVGSFGDIAVLGFYPNKQLTTGEGGAVLCSNATSVKRMRSLRNQGRRVEENSSRETAQAIPRLSDWLDHVESGYNYRLSELACALGRAQLSRLDEMLALRESAAMRYEALLKGVPGLILPPIELPQRRISWFVYSIRLPEHADRDRVQSMLADEGIESGRYFPPIHLQPAWHGRPFSCGRLPVTESIAPRMLSLPFFNRIEASQQRQVVDTLQSAIAAR